MLCSQTLEGTLQRRLGQVCFMRHFTAVETGEFQIRVPPVKTSLVVCQQTGYRIFEETSRISVAC